MKSSFLSSFCHIQSIIVLCLIVFGCKAPQPIEINSEDYHESVNRVTEIMVHDIFSPPVASRIYVYPNIAAWEILAQGDNDLKSLSGQLHGLKSIPHPENTENINRNLAALVAHIEISRQLIHSQKQMDSYRDSLYAVWSTLNKPVFQASEKFGMKVANFISDWLVLDNYSPTRSMPKFSIHSDNPARWQPTPPAYADAIEPHWNKIRPFVIDSAAQFKPPPPPDFSLKKESTFYKELQEVYDISKTITADGDESEEVEIAQFWDCNPYVSVTRGHLMFAIKKITPGAHWIGICKIACRKTKSDFKRTVRAYTLTSIAIADAFISCWDEKYRSNLVRPETLINLHMDEEWQPILQTPPFPEYVSGHSVVSGAASITLTKEFGADFSFADDTELPYGLPVRHFKSFEDAAAEAAISRMYGGIHYRVAVEIGLDQGQDLGNYVVHKLEFAASN